MNLNKKLMTTCRVVCCVQCTRRIRNLIKGRRTTHTVDAAKDDAAVANLVGFSVYLFYVFEHGQFGTLQLGF